MPKVKVLFGAYLGTGAQVNTVSFEEVKEFNIPQSILDEGDDGVSDHLQEEWNGWLDYHTSSIIELVEENSPPVSQGYDLLEQDPEFMFTKVTKPSHYNSTTITPFQVIDDWGLDFYLGNVIKYLCRAGKKGLAKPDLLKAQEYLQQTINRLPNE